MLTSYRRFERVYLHTQPSALIFLRALLLARPHGVIKIAACFGIKCPGFGAQLYIAIFLPALSISHVAVLNLSWVR